MSVRPVAEVGPETVKPPAVFWQQLALVFEPGVRVPELRREEKPSVSLDAARVDL